MLVALTGPMVWGALSGMEVALAALLVTATFVLHARGRAWAAGAALGLAALARPEAVLLLPLFWLAGPLTARRALAWGLPVAGCLAPWVAFNLGTTGTPLPATAAAKIEGGLLGYLAGVREPLRTTLARPAVAVRDGMGALAVAGGRAPAPPAAAGPLVARAPRRPRRAGARLRARCSTRSRMALLAPYRAPSFQEGRYSIHLLPLALVVAIAPLTSLFSLSPKGGERRERGARWLRARAGWIAFAALLIGAVAALPSAATRYGWAVQNIEAMQVHLGHWVASHTPPTARVGLNDVGAIAYISRREVVDVMGLVTPAIIPFRRDGEMGVLRYLEHACPDYLIVFPAWFPTISAMAERFHPVYRVRLAHNEVAGADELVGLRDRLEPVARRPAALSGGPGPGSGGSTGDGLGIFAGTV